MRCNSKAKHSVTMEAHFWISTTFLERDGHLHCRTMKERCGLPFFFLNSVMYRKVIHVNLFCFFCHISRTTVFFLLPWQRDKTTSPLYILESKMRESQKAKGRDCHVPFFCPLFYRAFRLLLSIYNVRVSIFTFSEEGPRIIFS